MSERIEKRLTVREQNFGISDFVRNVLEHDVVVNNYFIYSVPLVIMKDDESTRLDDGRFRNFSHRTQDHTVILPLAAVDVNTTIIDWIAEHVRGVWSLSVDMNNVQVGVLAFSFSDLKTAAIFRLTHS